jgi:hypothetical protein
LLRPLKFLLETVTLQKQVTLSHSLFCFVSLFIHSFHLFYLLSYRFMVSWHHSFWDGLWTTPL